MVIETSESYPKKIAVDFVKDKTELLNNIAVGSLLSVKLM